MRMTLGAQIPGLLLAGALAAGCSAHAEPLTASVTPTLNVPEPPGRYVLPAPEQPTLPPTVEEPPASSASASTAKPPVRNPNPRVPPSPPPTETPVAVPTPTPTPAILLTSANTAEFEKRVNAQLDVARSLLGQVNTPPPGTEARAHYDAAKGFIRQAEEALKVKNLIYAGALADKAATMAALLRK
jgi:hypothetical protein